MKKIVLLFTVLFASTLSAQINKPGISNLKADTTQTPEKTAGAGESLIVAGSKTGKKAAKKNRVPDGSYGSNRSGQVYSPSNPNYPYDRNGKIINSPGVEIITASKQQSAKAMQTAAPSMQATKENSSEKK